MRSAAAGLTLFALFWNPSPDRSLTADAAGKHITVRWASPADRQAGEWIGIYRTGAAVEPFPPSNLWRYVPAGESGEMAFEVPESGEWEARWLSAANTVLAATGLAVTDSAPVPSRLRKLSYYENGTLLWESETMDDTEAARHLANLSVSDRKGVEARIEVRYATVTYPAEPDELGTWRK